MEVNRGRTMETVTAEEAQKLGTEAFVFGFPWCSDDGNRHGRLGDLRAGLER
jgi:hypothetical protein